MAEKLGEWGGAIQGCDLLLASGDVRVWNLLYEARWVLWVRRERGVQVGVDMKGYYRAGEDAGHRASPLLCPCCKELNRHAVAG